MPMTSRFFRPVSSSKMQPQTWSGMTEAGIILDRIEDVGAEQLPLPIYLEGELPPTPTMAPQVGEQTDEVLAELGLSPERIAELRASGAVGPREN